MHACFLCFLQCIFEDLPEDLVANCPTCKLCPFTFYDFLAAVPELIGVVCMQCR